MSDYKPGTVAVATVRGVKGVRVMRTDGVGGGDTIWLSVGNVKHWRTHYAEDVTDIRPLVVLDLADAEVAGLLGPNGIHALALVAHQIDAQIKSPRIPEPELWGVVEAHLPCEAERKHFVHHDTANSNRPAWHETCGGWRHWDDLIDPVLVREGVES